jgi:hypothetical protein
MLLSSVTICAAQLDFGAASEEEVVNAASLYPYRTEATIAFLLYVALFIAFTAYMVLRSKRDSILPTLHLGRLPDAAKVLVTLLFFSYGLVHALALIEVYIKTKVVFTSAQEYFSYQQIGKLVATSHAHFFGHGTMYSLTSGVFLFASVNERIKVLLICMAIGAGLLDVPSWWMMKYAGGHWETASAIAGSMSAIGWGGMVLILLYQIWVWKGPSKHDA